MRQLEQEIALLENNIGFFARSKNAEALVADVRQKIERALSTAPTVSTFSASPGGVIFFQEPVPEFPALHTNTRSEEHTSELQSLSRIRQYIGRYAAEMGGLDLVAVSYTHLDVYKRQALARSIFCRTSATSASAFFDRAKKPMLFSSRAISCSSWRTLP